MMRVSFWVAFLIVIGVAIFAIQNSSAPPVLIQFLFWKFETSLVYTILGSVVLGMILVLLLWIPKAIRRSFQKDNLPQGTPRSEGQRGGERLTS